MLERELAIKYGVDAHFWCRAWDCARFIHRVVEPYIRVYHNEDFLITPAALRAFDISERVMVDLIRVADILCRLIVGLAHALGHWVVTRVVDEGLYNRFMEKFMSAYHLLNELLASRPSPELRTIYSLLVNALLIEHVDRFLEDIVDREVEAKVLYPLFKIYYCRGEKSRTVFPLELICEGLCEQKEEPIKEAVSAMESEVANIVGEVLLSARNNFEKVLLDNIKLECSEYLNVALRKAREQDLEELALRIGQVIETLKLF